MEFSLWNWIFLWIFSSPLENISNIFRVEMMSKNLARIWQEYGENRQKGPSRREDPVQTGSIPVWLAVNRCHCWLLHRPPVLFFPPPPVHSFNHPQQHPLCPLWLPSLMLSPRRPFITHYRHFTTSSPINRPPTHHPLSPRRRVIFPCCCLISFARNSHRRAWRANCFKPSRAFFPPSFSAW